MSIAFHNIIKDEISSIIGEKKGFYIRSTESPWCVTISVDCPMGHRLSLEIKGNQRQCFLDARPDAKIPPRWRDLIDPEEVDRLFADIRIIVDRSYRTDKFDKTFRVGVLVINSVAFIAIILKTLFWS